MARRTQASDTCRNGLRICMIYMLVLATRRSDKLKSTSSLNQYGAVCARCNEACNWSARSARISGKQLPMVRTVCCWNKYRSLIQLGNSTTTVSFVFSDIQGRVDACWPRFQVVRMDMGSSIKLSRLTACHFRPAQNT
jgi:hypothetical protein